MRTLQAIGHNVGFFVNKKWKKSPGQRVVKVIFTTLWFFYFLWGGVYIKFVDLQLDVAFCVTVLTIIALILYICFSLH